MGTRNALLIRFAEAALAGILAAEPEDAPYRAADVAKRAWDIAEALVAEAERRGNNKRNSGGKR